MPTEVSPGTAGRAFPVEEYQSRVAMLRTTMQLQGVELLIIDQFEHLAYFTGHIPTAAMYQCCLLPLQGEPLMVVRNLDGPMLEEMSWVRSSVLFSDSDDPLALVAQIIGQRGWHRSAIGVETDSHFLLARRLHQLKSALPEARFLDFSGHMWEQRLYKSPREIDYLRHCSHICDSATLAGVRAVGISVNERHVAAEITRCALEEGADNTRLLLMQSGPRSSTLHGGLGQRILQRGDIVHIEMVPHYRGYTARSMRPVIIGEPDAATLTVAQQLVACQDAQFAAMRPGAHAGEVDRLLRDAVLKLGLRETYTNISGYTLGLVCIPRTSDFTRVFLPDSDWYLKAGMVFHMYVWAQGMAFSETVLITDRGAERLTQLERHLFIASGESA
ncbi:M24 family metallopeptidase [Erwinia typographi]|nr:Xaa-Pro peptidase family protein [Erwinia typographi]